jgi:Flp pilus assembly protein TadD
MPIGLHNMRDKMMLSPMLSNTVFALLAVLVSGCNANGKPNHNANTTDGTVQTANANMVSAADAEKLETLVAAASNEEKRGNFEKANSLLDNALSLIGDSYIRPDVLDDTGLKLALAQAEIQNGDFEKAVALKKSVITSRRAMLAR